MMARTMTLQPDAAYLALRSRDARFDGRLFVGVTSTGIYCRPVCRVRTPRSEHCRFFSCAAAAEQAGFRPCLRCRPEQAPGLSRVDSPQVLAHEAARLLDRAAHQGETLSLTALAQRLGVTDRHLRRIFRQVHGVAPLDYLHTRRLLLAKQLLTDTRMSIGDVALASGYASARRLHAAFVSRYRLSPMALRRTAPTGARGDDALVFHLGYRPPYDVAGVWRFLALRAIDGIEAVHDGVWQRTLHVAGREGWLTARVEPDRQRVRVTLSPDFAALSGVVLQRVRQALDLDADPALIDPVLAALPCPPVPGLRVPNGLDGFETAVRVILGQQVTVAAARTLVRRLVDRFGTPIATPLPSLYRVFPSAEALAAADPDQIGQLGIVRKRVRALQALATEVQAGRLVLDASAPLAPTLAALQALPGIGEWSAQLIALRSLAWPDAFPASDIGLLNALGHRDVAAARVAAEAWRPWRGYAVMRLWQTLEVMP